MWQALIHFRPTPWTVLPIAAFVAAAVTVLSLEPTLAQQPLAEPPADQTYVGFKECATCHFDQFIDWQKTKHAKAFEGLDEKFQSEPSCVKCHSTGYGEPSGFKNIEETPNLAGITCESCHGPGSTHVEEAKSLANQKLTDQEKAYLRSTIYEMLPKNVCVQCHLSQAHKKHPEDDK